MSADKERAERRQRAAAILAAIIVMAAFHALVAFGAPAIASLFESVPEQGVFAALRLCFAGVILLLWRRVLAPVSAGGTKDGDKDERLRALITSDRASYIALAALCGALLQLASASAAALALSADSVGVRAAFGDAATWMKHTSAVAVTPICEEIVYRGAAFRLLRRSAPTVTAAFFTAIAFGLIHADAISAAVACYVGFFAAIMYDKRGSLLPAIALHAAFNLTSFFAGYIPLSPAAVLGISAPLAVAGMIAILKGKKK